MTSVVTRLAVGLEDQSGHCSELCQLRSALCWLLLSAAAGLLLVRWPSADAGFAAQVVAGCI